MKFFKNFNKTELKYRLKKFKQQKIITTYLVLQFFLILYLNNKLKVLDLDALSYILNAKTIIGIENYFEWHRPILYPLILAISFKIFGYTEIIARIISTILSVTSFYFFYLLVSKLSNEKTALKSTLILTNLPLIMYWSPRMHTEIPALGLISLSLYYLIRYAKETRNQKKNLTKHGIVIGLATLMNYTSILILPISLIILWHERKLNKKYTKAITAFSLTITPWLIFNYINTGKFIYSMKIANYQASVLTPSFLNYYAQRLNHIFTYSLLLLVAWYLYTSFTKNIRNNPTEMFYKKDLSTFSGITLLISFLLYYQVWLNLKDIRYIIPALIGFSILAGSGLEKLINKIKIPKKIFLIIFFTLPLLTTSIAQNYFVSCEDYASLGTQINNLEPGMIATPTWPYITYYSNKTAKWLPHTYEKLLEETQKFEIKHVLIYEKNVEPTWAATKFFNTVNEFTKIKDLNGCYGDASIYKYEGQIKKEIKPEDNVENNFAFAPLKII